MADRGVALQQLEHGEARLVRKPDVEHDRLRPELPREPHRVAGRARDDAFEAELAREIAQDFREGGVVLDDQHDAARIVDRRRGRRRSASARVIAAGAAASPRAVAGSGRVASRHRDAAAAAE